MPKDREDARNLYVGIGNWNKSDDYRVLASYQLVVAEVVGDIPRFVLLCALSRL